MKSNSLAVFEQSATASSAKESLPDSMPKVAESHGPEQCET
jgi:hypothetical protein